MKKKSSRFNITNPDEPTFLIESLDTLIGFNTIEDQSLKAIVFAVNQKGRSSGLILKDFLYAVGLENRTIEIETSFQLSPIILGILLTLLILCCFIIVKIYTSKRTRTMNNALNNTKHSNILLAQDSTSSKVCVI